MAITGPTPGLLEELEYCKEKVVVTRCQQGMVRPVYDDVIMQPIILCTN